MARVTESVLDLCKVFIMHDSLRIVLCIREIPEFIIEGKTKVFFSKLDTVVKILCHVYPLRAWCNARVVCSRPLARDSRSMSRAIRPSKQSLLRTRYTLFCLFRWRRLPRSTALEVAGNNVSSRNVRAFSRCGEQTFFTVSPIQVNRLTHCRNFFSLPSAVCVRQRRSNNV